MKHLILGVLIAMTAATAPADAAPAPTKPVSIVLVHGAFVDASGWNRVYNMLTQDGYEVLVVQNPTITVEGDVAATRQAIAKASHPVVLVAHSYGGAVITEAGIDPKVRSLVYLAAFAPEVGESVFELATKVVPGESQPPILPPSDGFLLLDPAKFPSAFAPDVDISITGFMAAAQVPWGMAAVEHKATRTAWKEKPTFFMVTAQDRIIPPTTLRNMAARAKATIVEIQSSHAVMLAHPKEVTAFIERAAADVK